MSVESSLYGQFEFDVNKVDAGDKVGFEGGNLYQDGSTFASSEQEPSAGGTGYSPWFDSNQTLAKEKELRKAGIDSTNDWRSSENEARYPIDDSDSLLKKYAGRDWNTEYLETFNPEDVGPIFALSQDFTFAAQAFAHIIISEICLPYEKKTIKPIGLGGIAGGEKYYIQGILFKFAMDTKISGKPLSWMYGGKERRDDLAMKAAGTEMNNLTAYATSHVYSLKLPFTTLIDYKGFRLIALAVLPISKKTLCYGSADGGASVQASDPKLNELMKTAAKMLNIKGHYVGLKDKKFLHGPGDIEAHLGYDGRYYVVDTGRAMPPEAPLNLEKVKQEPRAVFYKFLRPEWVRKQPNPLCSDAFTCWDCSDPAEVQKNQEEVRTATMRLIQEHIPNFSKLLDEEFESYSEESLKSLEGVQKMIRDVLHPGKFHAVGINIRHLGRVRAHVTNPFLKKLLLSICLARVCKGMVRSKFRDAMMEITVPCEEPFKKIIIGFFNTVLGTASALQKQTDIFWSYDAKTTLQSSFEGILSQEEEADSFNIRSIVDIRVVFQLLVAEFVELEVGIEQDCFDAADSFKFVAADIKSLKVKARQWFMVEVGRAITLLKESQVAKIEGNHRVYVRTILRVLAFGANAKKAAPLCPVLSFRYSLIIMEALPYVKDEDKEFHLNTAIRCLEQEVLPFKKFWSNSDGLIKLYATTLETKAQLLEKKSQFESAKEYYEKAKQQLATIPPTDLGDPYAVPIFLCEAFAASERRLSAE